MILFFLYDCFTSAVTMLFHCGQALLQAEGELLDLEMFSLNQLFLNLGHQMD